MTKGQRKSSMKANISASISTIVGITLVLTMLGFLSILLLTADSIGRHFKEHITMQVMLVDDTSEAQAELLKKQLEAETYVRQVRYIDKEEAARIEEEELGEEFVEFLGFNPIPASFEVNFSAEYASLDSLRWIEKDIVQRAHVQEVVYQEELLERVNKNIQRMSYALLLFSALLLIIAIALINNTIRLAIFSKRFLIKSMQLVGATSAFIRRPFILQGIRYGVYAAVLAMGIVIGFLYLLKDEFPEMLDVLMEDNKILLLAGILLSLGALIAWISTHRAVRRFIVLKQEKLYG